VAESLYTPDEIAWLPESVTAYALGLGNPIRYADLQPGENVLDVGCGAAIDTFLAARKVAPTGIARRPGLGPGGFAGGRMGYDPGATPRGIHPVGGEPGPRGDRERYGGHSANGQGYL